MFSVTPIMSGWDGPCWDVLRSALNLMEDTLRTYYKCTLPAVAKKLNVFGQMLLWTIFLTVVCGTRTQSLFAPFSYTLYISYLLYRGNWNSVVGIATDYRLEDPGVEVGVQVGSRIFSCPRRPDRLWGPHSLLFNGYRGSFHEMKLPGREADHLPPTSAQVKKIWLYHPLPHTPSWRSA
jgi:hypothetical protein